MNFTYRGVLGSNSPETKTFDVVAGGLGGTIKIGDIVIIANGYAVFATDGSGASGTLFGYAISDSTETGAVNGVVTCLISPMGLILRGTATTPGNLAAATLYDKITLDISSTVQTVDENDPGSNALLLYNYPFSDYATTGIVDIVVPFGNLA
jgi:hypothetical protein